MHWRDVGKFICSRAGTFGLRRRNEADLDQIKNKAGDRPFVPFEGRLLFIATRSMRKPSSTGHVRG